MGRRSKLEKFAELLTFPNVLQNYFHKDPKLTGFQNQVVERRGKWNTRHFKKSAPITLELACGKGEYSLGLAKLFPQRHFIGVDIKGNRIWKGAKMALSEELSNVAFLRTRIEQIDLFFAPDEIDEIWITFPDPFLKKSKANRRLTSAFFLNIYLKILKEGGTIHLKTDSDPLYRFTLETLSRQTNYKLISASDDIYAAHAITAELEIKTHYEKMHLENGRTIKYVRFIKKIQL